MSQRDISHLQDTGVVRRGKYVDAFPIGHQLDAIIKAIKHLAQEANVTLPQDMQDLITHTEAVKAKHPKRVPTPPPQE